VYVTYETDVKRLGETAASFELIEDLLAGIAPRRKLFLMDTCESGDTDEGGPSSGPGQRGLHARNIRSLVLEGAEVRPRTYLYDHERLIESDLTRRTGAIVFSSSRGSEASYELDALANGAFTKAIKEALGGAADSDGDGEVSTEELRAYVERSVPALTGDRQHPTVDRDNPAMSFGFPVRKGVFR
jgi:hypothetical protein